MQTLPTYHRASLAERWDAEAFIRDTRQRECHRPALHSRSDELAPGHGLPQPRCCSLAHSKQGGLAGLWVTNGTAAGTTEVGGIGSAGINGVNSAGLFGPGSYPFFTVFGNEVLFHGSAVTCRCG